MRISCVKGCADFLVDFTEQMGISRNGNFFVHLPLGTAKEWVEVLNKAIRRREKADTVLKEKKGEVV